MIETGGIKPNYIPSDKTSQLEKIDTILSYQYQPFDTPKMAILWNTNQKMEQNDIRIF